MRTAVIFFFFLLSFFALSAFGQERPASLILDKTIYNEAYFLNGQLITERQAMQAMALSPEAVALIKSSRRTEALSFVLLGFGFGALTGSMVAGANTQEFPVAPIIASAIFLTSGLVLFQRAIKKAHNGVALYTYQQHLGALKKRQHFFSIAVKQNSLLLTYRF